MSKNNNDKTQNRSNKSTTINFNRISRCLRHFGISILTFVCPLLRNFPIEIRGEENLPDGAAVYACNHSNSHDIFVGLEVFSLLGRPVTPLVAWDGLNILSRTAFTLGNAVFIRRPDKISRKAGFEKFCAKIRQGENGIIFPESTWNLHPVRPMQKLNAGFLRASIAECVPVVPVIMEYEEIPDICEKESGLYKRCIVTFGKPVIPSVEENLYTQAESIREIMSDMRISVWEEISNCRTTMDQIDQKLYLNHLDVKKNRAFGFRYNTEEESKFLLDKENEYILTDSGAFVPAYVNATAS